MDCSFLTLANPNPNTTPNFENGLEMCENRGDPVAIT